MTLANPQYEYEVQWESEAGNRRVETVEGDGYETFYKPSPYLRVWVERDNTDETEDVFEVVGFNFTINRITE